MSVLTVRFSRYEEYVEELEHEAGFVAGKILRYTFRHRRSATVPITAVSLVSTCLVGTSILQLEMDLGDMWAQEQESTQAVQKRMDELAARLKQDAGRLGLEVRAGLLSAG